MEVIVVKNYEEMSRKAASVIEEKVNAEPDCVLGLATGGTPLGTYEQLIEGHRSRGIDYSGVTTFNLDEYVGLPRDHSQSYHTFMQEQLFSHIPFLNTYIPNGEAEDLDKECREYEALLDKEGPANIQLLGIGSNGHIGFNEPGASFEAGTHVEKLDQVTREANARFFPSLEAVPTEAVTMGIASILKSEEILLLASGANKQEAIRRLLKGEVGEMFPASALYNHKHVTLIVDEEAYGKGVDASAE
ncbi:glucosamine-6-phosphate deaminase [Salimicrobium salexigens]|uniref:Glucosamine-6-phosphate deaminase n=1 Tax=Salimicrobium salexigens TaxID=908941 RepID=A0ABY1KZD1_9BACI|nr:glucosamine-6-phosphate deaminase [Salimicrobium salexigens]SIS81336.1 glucosamine-6-phosphate deaminase [Salimicrobium salexigens]